MLRRQPPTTLHRRRTIYFIVVVYFCTSSGIFYTRVNVYIYIVCAAVGLGEGKKKIGVLPAAEGEGRNGNTGLQNTLRRHPISRNLSDNCFRSVRRWRRWRRWRPWWSSGNQRKILLSLVIFRIYSAECVVHTKTNAKDRA